jgi:hypothetical protein
MARRLLSLAHAMTKLPESRLLAIVALGVACFSAGFSVTASAYASLVGTAALDQPISHAAAASAARELRNCAQQ